MTGGFLGVCSRGSRWGAPLPRANVCCASGTFHGASARLGVWGEDARWGRCAYNVKCKTGKEREKAKLVFTHYLIPAFSSWRRRSYWRPGLDGLHWSRRLVWIGENGCPHPAGSADGAGLTRAVYLGRPRPPRPPRLRGGAPRPALWNWGRP